MVVGIVIKQVLLDLLFGQKKKIFLKLGIFKDIFPLVLESFLPGILKSYHWVILGISK
jgi:hypothetical protein